MEHGLTDNSSKPKAGTGKFTPVITDVFAWKVALEAASRPAPPPTATTTAAAAAAGSSRRRSTGISVTSAPRPLSAAALDKQAREDEKARVEAKKEAARKEKVRAAKREADEASKALAEKRRRMAMEAMAKKKGKGGRR